MTESHASPNESDIEAHIPDPSSDVDELATSSQPRNHVFPDHKVIVSSEDKPERLVYERFEPGDCNQLLPLNRITDTILFSQFIGLNRDPSDGGGSRRVVVPRTWLWPALGQALVNGNANLSAIDAQGGIPLVDDWRARDLALPSEAEVPDLDTFLATKQVTIDGEELTVQLDEWTVQELMAGRSVVVPIRDKADRFVRLTSNVARDAKPATTVVQIPDLAMFLTRPAVPSARGDAIPLHLNVDTIRALRNSGRVDYPVNGVEVALTVVPQEGSISPIVSALTSEPMIESGMNTVGVALPESPSVVFYLPWRQTWTLLGYSRGALLNTLSLAPQEETTIEVFTWDRRKREIDRTSSVEADGSTEQSDTVRDTIDIVNELDRSNEFSSQVDGRIGVSYKVVTGGVGGQVNTKDAMKSAARQTSNHISESVRRASYHIKSSRQTKVSETSEFGREERVTRKIRNANMCRTLNLDYFEVLSHYEVTTELDLEQANLCLLVQNPLQITFDRNTLRIYERPLRRALLDPGLVDGFSAARVLEAWTRACDIACRQCSCHTSTAVGTDWRTAWNWLDAMMQPVLESFRAVVGANHANWMTKVNDGLKMGTGLFGLSLPERNVFQMWIYNVGIEIAAPLLYEELLRLLAKQPPYNFDDVDRLAHAATLSGGLETISPIKIRDEQRGRIKEVTKAEWLRLFRNTSRAFSPEDMETFLDVLGSFDVFDDAGLYVSLSRVLSMRELTLQALAAPSADIKKSATIATDTVQSSFDAGALAEASERENALIGHLQQHGSYYRYALWKALTPAAQADYLVGLLPPGLVEPRAVGYVGNHLAFPIIPEIHNDIRKLLDEIISGIEQVEPITEDIILPTLAVTVETRLGACEGCEEFIVKHRELDLAQKEAEVDAAKERAEQEKLETQRYQKRLAATPPQLEDPDPNEGDNRLRLSIRQEK